MSPRTSRSIANSLSIDGLAARQTIMRPSPPRSRRAPPPWSAARRCLPSMRADSAPHALARASASSSGAPATNAGQEPRIERVAGAGGVDDCRRDRRAGAAPAPAGAAIAPSAPALTTTSPARAAQPFHRLIQIGDPREPHRLHLVRQEHVDRRQQVHQAAVPLSRWIPVGVDRRGEHPGRGPRRTGQAGRAPESVAGSRSSRGRAQRPAADRDRPTSHGDRRSCRAR